MSRKCPLEIGPEDLYTETDPGENEEVIMRSMSLSCTSGVVWQCGEDGGHWVFVDPCAGAYGCVEGACECVGSCEGIECGPDECGNWCGICDQGWACAEAQCVCAPSCLGKECGDDGCGGDCGPCERGQTCLGNQCAGPCDAALGVPSNMGCEF